MVDPWIGLYNREIEGSSVRFPENGISGEEDGEKMFDMVAFIGECIKYKDWGIIIQLYGYLVRPHLEYCIAVLQL